VDDNATFADPTDDREVERVNADIAMGNALAAVRWERDAHRWALLGMVVHQARGLPGPATVVSPDSRQIRTRILTSLGYRFRGDTPGRTDAFATVAVGFDEERVRDPFGRIGLGREDSEDRYLSIDARGGAFVELWPWLSLGTTTFFRHDDIRPRDRFATPGDQPATRDLLVVAAESHLSALYSRFELTLRGSASAQSTWVRRDATGRMGAESALRQTVPNFRLEAAANFASSLSLSALLTSGVQLPTILQLFGNRDTIVANPDLQPERSLSVDTGLRYAPRWGPVLFNASLRFFWLDVEDIIVARRTAINTVVFRNEREGNTWGTEIGLDVTVDGWLRSSTSLTVLKTRFDNAGFESALPLRVPLRWFQRWSVPLVGRALDASLEIDHRSAFFTDVANQVEQPSLTVVNVGFEAISKSDGLRLGLYVRNLFDVLGQDLLAFPLPGRAFHISLQWRASPR
ncbi:MAG: TonB-dependent receptor, partial [Myxococcota bacterium]